MNSNTKRAILPLLFGAAIILTGLACADQPVPAVPETQGLVTTTGADVVGMATETDAAMWTLTNDPLVIYAYTIATTETLDFANLMNADLQSEGGSLVFTPDGGNAIITQINIPGSMLDNLIPDMASFITYQEYAEFHSTGAPQIITKGIHTGALDPEQIQYTTAYDANIVAQAGHTVLLKTMNINTGNKVLTQSNLKAHTGLTYIATSDGGNVVGSENLLLDGAGNTTHASDRMLCPFVPIKAGNVIPAYCNIVQTGNAYDLTVGSVTSDMSERFVGTDATVPVQLDHVFNVKPYGTTDGSIPAMGSTSAYLKAHVQEARGYTFTTIPAGEGFVLLLETTPAKAEDVQYAETSSASGYIQQFTKEIHYQSGRAILP